MVLNFHFSIRKFPELIKKSEITEKSYSLKNVNHYNKQQRLNLNVNVSSKEQLEINESIKNTNLFQNSKL